MGTSIHLIMAAQEVKPGTIQRPCQPVAGVTLLDASRLRREVEFLVVKRALVWDEWLDVRDRWCKRYRAHGVEVVKGHTPDLPAVAALAKLRGYEYLLVEEIT